MHCVLGWKAPRSCMGVGKPPSSGLDSPCRMHSHRVGQPKNRNAGAGSTCEGVDLFTLDAINKWHSHIFFTCRRCRECSYIGKQSRIRGPDSRGCVIRSCDSFCGLGQVAAVYRRLRQAWAWSETRRRIKEGVLGVGQAQAAEGGCKPGRVLGWGG